MKKSNFIKICPHCGSTNTTIPPAGMDLRMTMPDYCKECSNRGTFPEIKKSEIKKFIANLKKTNRNL